MPLNIITKDDPIFMFISQLKNISGKRANENS